MQDAGSYDLIVSSSDTPSVTLRFTVSSSKQALYIAAGISSVRTPIWTSSRTWKWVAHRLNSR